MLVGFRQFLQYHIQGMVQQLHTRMRKRVDVFAAVMKQARRDKVESK
jgi:hypothetical protein